MKYYRTKGIVPFEMCHWSSKFPNVIESNGFTCGGHEYMPIYSMILTEEIQVHPEGFIAFEDWEDEIIPIPDYWKFFQIRLKMPKIRIVPDEEEKWMKVELEKIWKDRDPHYYKYDIILVANGWLEEVTQPPELDFNWISVTDAQKIEERRKLKTENKI